MLLKGSNPCDYTGDRPQKCKAFRNSKKTDRDKIRQREIESLGVRFIRFTDEDVRYNLERVSQILKTEILRPSQSLGTPPLRKEE